MSASKIAVYSLPDLKNTTDDALPNYLNSLQFKQSHTLTDIRLGLGYSAVVIAGATFIADYKLGWDATKVGTFWAVIAYFILNGALTIWIWGVEKGKVYIGERDDTLLSIASSVTKHKPVYRIKVRYSERKGDWQTKELSAPFTTWFDADGHFKALPFQRWLASQIPIVGKADTQKAQKSGLKLEQARDSAAPETPVAETSGKSKAGDEAASANPKSRKSKRLG
ncbi:MAG: hypothetical protein LQ351_005916 [Letrouitia transgressa]|nr:MAG: hypothetical protein LQ351_005916 [Letrouitia transgressa]